MQTVIVVEPKKPETSRESRERSWALAAWAAAVALVAALFVGALVFDNDKGLSLARMGLSAIADDQARQWVSRSEQGGAPAAWSDAPTPKVWLPGGQPYWVIAQGVVDVSHTDADGRAVTLLCVHIFAEKAITDYSGAYLKPHPYNWLGWLAWPERAAECRPVAGQRLAAPQSTPDPYGEAPTDTIPDTAGGSNPFDEAPPPADATGDRSK